MTETETLVKLFPESGMVSRAEYFPEPEILEIEFKSNGKRFWYKNFPKEKWLELLKTDSIGKFINEEVKGKYDFKPIN